MAKINVLPKSVAELIAAGEVVERPMSVVKELIENSIDAGADTISVEIKNGGIRYIRITDNGCGIAREDVRTAFISHATSKISRASDLDAILTLGFRGEALPSVAAVSRLTLLTKTEQEEIGSSYTIEGGEEVSLEDAGCPVGTTIIVRDLFYNTPARMKFLRRDVTEGTYVSDAVTKASLSHPEIRFSLVRDGKKIFSTPGSDDLYSAVYAVFGKEVAGSLIPCDHEDGQISIHGFISKPLCNRPNRNMQYFFVNGRCVRIPAAAPALDEAYKNSIMVGKFPMCFLSLRLPADKTDVNVHPAKTEIRFAEETKLFEAIFYAARSALAKGDRERPSVSLRHKLDVVEKAVPQGTQMTFGDTEKQPPEKGNTVIQRVPEPQKPANLSEKAADGSVSADPNADLQKTAVPEKTAADLHAGGQAPRLVLHDTSADRSVDKNGSEPDRRSTGYNVPWSTDKKKASIDIAVDDEDMPPAKAPDVKTAVGTAKVFDVPQSAAPENDAFAERAPEKEPENIRVIGEAFGTYIIAERGSKLLIIDKHAAHERMIFNSLSAQNAVRGSQLLLLPVSVTLAPKEYAAVLDNLSVFTEVGYGVEDFGAGTVLVRSCPVELTQADIADVITEIAGKLLRGSLHPVPEKLDWLMHSTACRAAVKAGDELKPEETESFVKQLLADDSIRYCPHGRPVMYELSKHEIEKQFGRLG